ncbi:threonine ammonia-lyase [Comamonas serinivorans]|uniref:Threonine ammonia-lyase n=1 Tax=Comamonas serinivorans TaxID=1082851 RepID=A0A1Y0ER39_9BURK|nr:threonine ammonia-lyase [Comamonas serinivorans]ARU05968.1 threonine ammonia-lyase [Comamonas serinivorans]
MITPADIHAAAQRLQGQVQRTPCLHSQTLSRVTGAQVYLKFENLQFTASFKERGALNKLTAVMDEARASGQTVAGVIAMSAGNHAQGVAYHAQRLGLRAVIVMPRFTPGVKVAATEGFGAEVVLFGDTLEAARSHARELAVQQGLVFIHPYDDDAIMAGQGTVALEMLADQPDIDTLIVPVGGGGLLAGMATAARSLQRGQASAADASLGADAGPPQGGTSPLGGRPVQGPRTTRSGERGGLLIFGVQTERFPGMVNAVTGSHHPQGASTIAEGIAVGSPGERCAAVIREQVDELLLVDEGDIEHAIIMLLEIEKTLVEGAGAAGMAALLRHKDKFAGRKVGLVLSGGNIDPMLLAAIIDRGMVQSGRLVRLVVGARDVPGSLAQVTQAVADAGANVQEVHHQRAFTLLAAQHVEIELVLQTRGPRHVRDVITALQDRGFSVRKLD